MTFQEWAAKWNIPAAALQDLRTLYVPPPAGAVSTSEAATGARLRVEAAKIGAALWRNNSGACKDETGRMIRYGLGNDSKKLNDAWKSSDYVGPTPIFIKPRHVGLTMGIFTVAETKHPGWTKPENDRDRAQEAFMITVCQLGGLAMFVTHEDQYHGYVARIRA
jgi:hypothetical protein